MKKSILWMRNNVLPTLLMFVLSIAIVSVGTASSTPTSSTNIITQTNSTPTVYLDPPTITGTAIDQVFTVNIRISYVEGVKSWALGMIFNATLLECTGFVQGEFLKGGGSTMWLPGTINNTGGEITPYACILYGFKNVSASGRLAYATFRVKATGVSDLHFRDVEIKCGPYIVDWIPVNIIDVYTVVLDTTPHTVTTVSNSTSVPYQGQKEYDSGFYGHAFSAPDKEISFTVTGPSPGFANVTIPKTLLYPEPSYGWGVIIDGELLGIGERTVTESATDTSVYFTYWRGVHDVQITTLTPVGNISIALSSTVVALGSNVTISGAITPERPGVDVTILYRPTSGAWTTLATRTTDAYSNYSYTWTPDEGTYEVKARWAGDSETLGDESDVETLEVLPKELVVSLEAPTTLKHGDSSLLNATVTNLGPDETNVDLQLFINDSMVDSAVIPLLQRDSSYTLSYDWTTPIVEAMYVTYNVTAYAPPLPGEDNTVNNNATRFVGVRRIRELVVSPEAPTILEPGDSSLLNATVYNLGTNNETDVELQLLIDGEPKNSTVIGFLQVGTFGRLSHLWTPIDKGTYNVTAYAPPLPGEDDIVNNVANKSVTVWWLHDLVVSIEVPASLELGSSSLLNATVYNDGLSDETNVWLTLLINGRTVDSKLIPDLPSVSSSTLSYLWTPTVEGMYDVTADALPVTGESVTLNNVDTENVTVKWLHDLVVSLEALDFLRPGNETLINATVYNGGFSNETDVELYLLIDGTPVNNVTLPELVSGESYTINYTWKPDEGEYNVTAYAPPVPEEGFTGNNLIYKIVKVKPWWITIEPESGPIGSLAMVEGFWLPNQTQVLVTFNDMLIGYAMTDEVGYFNFTFNVPVSVAGDQTVKAFYTAVNYTDTRFTVIDVTPLDIEMDVGTIHFRGETAEFYVQTAFKGKLVNATITKATMYYSNGTMSLDLKADVEPISTGLYRIPYGPIPAYAPFGAYTFTIEASYTTDVVEANGVSSKSFLLSQTLGAENLLITDIKDEIATVIIPNLAVIKANLTAINAKLVSIEGRIATINSTLGLIQADVSTISATLISIDGRIATINSTLGLIQADVSTISATLTTINGTLVTIQTDIGLIQADIADIELKVTSIDGKIATIQTTLVTIEGEITAINGTIATIVIPDIGTVMADISKVKAAQGAFTPPLYAAVVLALIAAVGAILLLYLRRKTLSPKK